MKENNQEKREKALSTEARAEAVAKFAEAMNREDIDGFVFGVYSHGGKSNGIVGTKGVITFILSDIFVDSELDPNIFLQAVLMKKLVKRVRKEEEND